MNELLVAVTIAGRRCALRAHDVQSVIELGTITPIPCAPAHITGMSAMRSQALTVVDCRHAIGHDSEDFETDLRAPVVHIAGHSYALIVDEVEDIATATEEATTVTCGFGEEWSAIAKEMVETASGPALIINLEAMIAGPVDQAEAA